MVKQDDTVSLNKVLQYSEGDFSAYKCYKAINKGEEWVLRDDSRVEGDGGNKGIVDHGLEQMSAKFVKGLIVVSVLWAIYLCCNYSILLL